MSTAYLGFGNSLAGIIIALLAPVLGAIADKGGLRKRMLALFAYLGVLMTACRSLIGKGQWQWAIFIYVMGTVGFSGANVFYDSLLPLVAHEGTMDYISSLGYSMGYLGGGILFLFNVIMTLAPEKFGLPDSVAAVKLSFVSVALWWGVLSLFLLFWVPEPRRAGRQMGNPLKAGFGQLATRWSLGSICLLFIAGAVFSTLWTKRRQKSSYCISQDKLPF